MAKSIEQEMNLKYPTYEIRIENAPRGKWIGSIRIKNECAPIWTGHPWSVKAHAFAEACNIIRRDRINGREVLPVQKPLFVEPS